MNQLTILALLTLTITAQNSPACQQQCQGQISVVCGTNGVTYDSICLLTCNGQNILYRGACQPSTSTGGSGSGSGNPPIFGNNPSGSQPAPSQGPPNCVNQCNGLFALVCGSDGVTYQSPCALHCTSATLTILNTGYCVVSTGPVVTPPSGGGIIVGSTGPGTSTGNNNSCSCSADFSPVCGADGNTYANACLAACSNVAVTYNGACQSCTAACPSYYSYVCGTNGVTYQNQCYLTCQGNTNLAYYGRCSA